MTPAAARDREALARLDGAARRSWLEAYLARRAAEVMDVAVSRLDAATPLTAIGLDSLYAVQLAHEVETDLGVELPLAMLLDGPSIAELAAELAVRLDAAVADAVPAQDGTDGVPAQPGAASRMAAAAAEPAAAVPASPAAAPQAAEVPLTYGQRALYFLDRLDPQAGAYVIAGAARVRGSLDLDALRRALDALSERHPALRTTFAERGGEPVQTVHPRSMVALTVEQAPGDAAGPEAAAAALLDAAWRPFDLAQGPLLRVTVLAGGGAAGAASDAAAEVAADGAGGAPAAPAPPAPRDAVVVLAIHHLVADFWSLEVLLGELAALYRPPGQAPAEALRPLPLTFAEHARRQQAMLQGPRGERLWEFWRQELAGPLPVLDLPADRPRPRRQTFRGAGVPLRLPPAVVATLRGHASRQGATLFMALLALFQGLLARLSGQREVVVGAPVAGRDSADLAGLIGYFVNPVALRADLGAEPSFDQLLAATRSRALAAFRHQDFPLPLLAERLQPRRDPSRPPIFQASFVLQKAHRPERVGLSGFALGLAGSRLRLGGLDLESVALPRRASQFDLTLEAAEEGDQLAALLVHDSELFDDTTACRWCGHLAVLAAAAAAGPAIPIAALPWLSADERRQLLGFNATSRTFQLGGRAAAELSLNDLVAAQAARLPDAVAIELDDRALTFGELDAAAERLAEALAARGAGPESIVGLAADRSLAMVVGLLGILKAGAAYLPIDPTYPRERIAYMLADARPRVVLAAAGAAAALPADGPPILPLDAFAGPPERGRRPPGSAPDSPSGETTGPEPPAAPSARRARRARRAAGGAGPDRLAYVLYTSGSTGKPKAAMNGHRGIVNRLLWFQEVEPLGPGDRVLQKTPLSFDVSLWELFWPLIAGARLVLARPGGHLDTGYLVRTLAERAVTVAHFVPSMLQIFLEAPGLERCAALRLVVCSGEALAYDTQERFFARLPGVALYNLYGPTETAIEVTCWRCRPGEGRHGVPIGEPIANVGIQLLDRRYEPVPLGVAGQLAIAGIAVGRGYLGRPDLTAERFVPDPCAALEPGGRVYLAGDLARRRPGGAIEFLGRIDGQVKLRGVRIELGEIESVLASHPAVLAAAVAVLEAGSDRRLVAYVVPREGAAGGGAAAQRRDLEEHLRRLLPAAMVPAAFVTLDALPLTASGKVDRRALPAPGGAAAPEAAEPVPPGTAVEEALAEIWCDVLKLERVGIYDDFFALGGHSLNANQVLAQVREVFQVDLPVPSLFESPTIAGLAQAIARELMAEADEETLAAVLGDLHA